MKAVTEKNAVRANSRNSNEGTKEGRVVAGTALNAGYRFGRCLTWLGDSRILGDDHHHDDPERRFHGQAGIRGTLQAGYCAMKIVPTYHRKRSAQPMDGRRREDGSPVGP